MVLVWLEKIFFLKFAHALVFNKAKDEVKEVYEELVVRNL